MPEEKPDRLDGWKAIADYLGKDVSTAIRWARHRGMPVHRVPGGRGGTVYALAEDLDRWIKGTPSSGPGPSPGRRRVLTSTLLVCVVTVAGFFLSSWNRPRIPVRVSFAGNRFLASDENGRLAWAYDFGEPVRGPASLEISDPVRFIDLDADGRLEILAVVVFPGTDPTSVLRRELVCFSFTGKLLWRYKPRHTLRFGDRVWDGPWRFSALLTTHGSEKHVWAAIAHQIWWPSFLVTLDDQGHDTVRFIHAGVIYALNYLQGPSGNFVLAGGTNNEYEAAMLAVLAEGQPPAVSPQSDASYKCVDCGDSYPAHYFLFPPLEVTRLQHAYNRVAGITTNGARILVSTIGGTEPPPGEFGLYNFLEKFDVRDVSLSDSYPVSHRRLEDEGKIKHPNDKCPERAKPWIVRSWEPTTGWRDVQVPWAEPQRKDQAAR